MSVLDSENGKPAGVARRRIRLINADPRYAAIQSSLMPEAACGCDSNNPSTCSTDVPVCVADVPVNANVSGNCGIYG